MYCAITCGRGAKRIAGSQSRPPGGGGERFSNRFGKLNIGYGRLGVALNKPMLEVRRTGGARHGRVKGRRIGRHRALVVKLR